MPGLTFTVPAEYDGATVQNFLRRGCGLSWRMVVKLKQVPGGISADGVALRTIDPVAAGQRVELILPEDSVRIEGVELPLSVVYEDESLLLVDKPPYLAVHPSAGKPEPTLANAVVAHFEREGQPLSFRPINRLDRNTSGLVAAGCSLAGLQKLSAMFKDRSLHKYYLCVVSGSVKEKKRIEGFLKKDEKSNQVTISQKELPDSAPICTEYEPLMETESYTLLKVTLITGRTHQIRAHLASIGHPIVGDMKYGNQRVNEEAKRQYHIHSQMLHSWKLVFPQMEEPLAHLSGKSFTAPLPGEFQKVLGPLPEGVR